MKRTKHIAMTNRKNAGLTLVELLVAMLIMGLAGMIVVVGIPAATNAYKAAIDASNAQAVLSMTTENLRALLSTADPSEDILPASTADCLTEFTSLGDGSVTTLVNSDEGVLIKKEMGSLPGSQFVGVNTSTRSTPLVPEVAAVGAGVGNSHSKLTVRIDSIEYDEDHGCFEVKEITVKSSSRSENLDSAIVNSLTVKVIAAP